MTYCVAGGRFQFIGLDTILSKLMVLFGFATSYPGARLLNHWEFHRICTHRAGCRGDLHVRRGVCMADRRAPLFLDGFLTIFRCFSAPSPDANYKVFNLVTLSSNFYDAIRQVDLREFRRNCVLGSSSATQMGSGALRPAGRELTPALASEAKSAFARATLPPKISALFQRTGLDCADGL